MIRKSSLDKFIAYKTPLDDRYKDKIHVVSKWTCAMLIKAVQTEHVRMNHFFLGDIYQCIFIRKLLV